MGIEKKKVLLLGCGRVGKQIAVDLAHDFKVVVSDINPKACSIAEVMFATFDCTDVTKNLEELIRIHNPDLVINAMSSKVGYNIMERVIKCGKNLVDISFMKEDPRDLEMRALLNNVIVVPDCGVMPGLGSIMSGYAAEHLTNCTEIDILVGGLPRFPEPPYFYKAPFAPEDVLEEYTRPARIKRDGGIETHPAMSDVREIWIDDYKLEAFNTDGLRTLLSLPVPNLTEKTIRWPGHAEAMKEVLGDRTDLAMFDTTNLFKAWQYKDHEPDLTFLVVLARGENELGGETLLTWKLIDTPAEPWIFSSMARTTAFPATTIARLILNGHITQDGIIMPEMLGRDPKIYRAVIESLKHKGLDIQCRASATSFVTF